MLRTQTGRSVRALGTLVAGALLAGPAAEAGEIEGLLAVRLEAAEPTDIVEANVHVRGGADAAQMKAAGATRAEILVSLRETADRSQRGVRAELEAMAAAGEVLGYDSFWGFNGFVVRATPGAIARLAARADVEIVSAVTEVSLPQPPASVVEIKSATSNLQAVRVPDVWSAFGLTGAGVVVANVDSGVSSVHPALGPKWRGGTNSWFDSVLGTPAPPTDGDGHGTRTMGIMVAGDGDAGSDPNDVGIAYDATWIAARIFNGSGGGATTTVIHNALQWLMDPDGNPATDDLPDIVNNSWGSNAAGCFFEFNTDVQNLSSLGVITVFSSGNDGPAAASIRHPSYNGSTTAVGSTNNAMAISSFSSRGHNPCSTGDPGVDIVAPGENIVSTLRGGGYGGDFGGFEGTGTSFSAPTVAGVLALMKEADPGLTPYEARAILKHSAVERGTPGQDKDYGHGFLDAYEAVDRVLTPRPAMYIASTVIDDGDSTCNVNGVAQPGEAGVNVGLALRNEGFVTATGVTVTLSTTDPNVTVLWDETTYPNVAPGGTGFPTSPLVFHVLYAKTAFEPITFILDIATNEGTEQRLFNIPTGETCPGGCYDLDGDGFSPFDNVCFPVDCDDTNPDVYPGAAEVCANGIDDDCDGLADGADPDCPATGCAAVAGGSRPTAALFTLAAVFAIAAARRRARS